MPIKVGDYSADLSTSQKISLARKLCQIGCNLAAKVLKIAVQSPMFKDLMGRLTVLLHVLLQFICFIIIVNQLASDAAWWRSTALADSYKVCRAQDPSAETLQLCSAFRTELQALLDVFAVGCSAECLKLCTAAGAMCCSRQLATSTRLDRGSWFDNKRLRQSVGRYRHSKASRLSYSKPCQWRAAALACGVWGLCLLCDLTVCLAVGWYGIMFKSQVSEYSEELFPEAMDEQSWGSIVLTVVILVIVLGLDTLMMASAAIKLKGLSDIKDDWSYRPLRKSKAAKEELSDSGSASDQEGESVEMTVKRK